MVAQFVEGGAAETGALDGLEELLGDDGIGIDVGTGSARACIMNDQGDIVGLASENIGLWQPQTGYYVLHSHVTAVVTEN